MEAILTEKIPAQAFELIANRIAEILTIEIKNQVDIQNFDDEVEVVLERIHPFEGNEDVSVQVYFKGGNFDGQTQKDVQGEYMYFIDLYTTAMGIGSKTSSEISKNKNYRYTGIIRYILNSGKYPTLGFPAGMIGGKYIKSISADLEFSNFGADPSNSGSNIRLTRFIFIVRAQENQALWKGVALDGNTTNITYNESALGTQLILTNN